MFRYGDDDNELRGQYNFGELESATNRQTSGRANPSEVNVSINEPPASPLEDYSPREDDHQIPASPQAFGPTDSTPVNAPATAVGYQQALSAQKDQHQSGKKMSVFKEVIGANKKNTKGKSDEEKQQILLEQRWKNAMKEEERLTELEGRIASGEVRTEMMEHPPNFPRKFLCIRPLVYHDISSVPPQRQRFVKMAFWDWVAVCILLVANCGIASGVPFAPNRETAEDVKDVNKALNLVLACVYLVGIPSAFILWYWRVYRACSTGRPAQHIAAMSGFIISLAQAIFCFIGPKNYGACGIALTIWVGKTKSRGILAPLVIMIFFWFAQAVFTCYLLVQQFLYYRKDLAARRLARDAAPPVVG